MRETIERALRGTTWLSGGFWAPDGAYSRFVSPVIGLVWFVVVSRVLLTRSAAARQRPEPVSARAVELLPALAPPRSSAKTPSCSKLF